MLKIDFLRRPSLNISHPR